MTYEQPIGRVDVLYYHPRLLSLVYIPVRLFDAHCSDVNLDIVSRKKIEDLSYLIHTARESDESDEHGIATGECCEQAVARC